MKRKTVRFDLEANTTHWVPAKDVSRGGIHQHRRKEEKKISTQRVTLVDEKGETVQIKQNGLFMTD